MSARHRLNRAAVARTRGAKGHRADGNLFSLSIFTSPGETTVFTCVVSKQVAAKATERNRVKRRCREAVRAHLDTAPPNEPRTLIFRAKSASRDASFSDIERDIGGLLSRALR